MEKEVVVREFCLLQAVTLLKTCGSKDGVIALAKEMEKYVTGEIKLAKK